MEMKKERDYSHHISHLNELEKIIREISSDAESIAEGIGKCLDFIKGLRLGDIEYGELLEILDTPYNPISMNNVISVPPHVCEEYLENMNDPIRNAMVAVLNTYYFTRAFAYYIRCNNED